MTNYLSEHWIVSIVATIILGAIGSGLWETALKPISKRLGGFLYTLITFGATRARDEIYKEASRGHHELPSILLLAIIIVVGISTMIGTQTAIYTQLYQESSLILPVDLEQCAKIQEPNQRHQCIRENMRPLLQIMTLTLVFTVVIVLYQLIKINLVNLVTTNYQQCLKAVRPFLDDNDAYLIEQSYALMTTKAEYVAIMKNIVAIAKSNSSPLPIDSYN